MVASMRKASLYVLMFAVVTIVSACTGDRWRPCTALYAYGVTATVQDELGNPVPGATLTLSEGSYQEILEEWYPGEYVGAGERAGTYTLTVVADGFETVTVDDIFVDADECHVIGVSRQINLQSIS